MFLLWKMTLLKGGGIVPPECQHIRPAEQQKASGSLHKTPYRLDRLERIPVQSGTGGVSGRWSAKTKCKRDFHTDLREDRRSSLLHCRGDHFTVSAWKRVNPRCYSNFGCRRCANEEAGWIIFFRLRIALSVLKVVWMKNITSLQTGTSGGRDIVKKSERLRWEMCCFNAVPIENAQDVAVSTAAPSWPSVSECVASLRMR